MTDGNLIGTADAARQLGIDSATLTRWVKDGRITPAGKITGLRGSYVFTRAEVTRVAALHTPAASP